MTISIEISDWQYRDIESYCKLCKISVQEYLVGIISEKHSINKFGDLNEIVKVDTEKSEVKAKKRGRPKKTEAEDEKSVEIKEDDEQHPIEEEPKPILAEPKKPTVRKKRTLNPI